MRKFWLWACGVLLLATVGFCWIFSVQNAETQVRFFLNLGPVGQWVVPPEPVGLPTVIFISVFVGFLGGILLPFLRPRRSRRPKSRGGRSEVGLRDPEDFDL